MVIEERWRATASLLANHRDVLDGRPTTGEAPAALRERGWDSYLLALDDAQVDHLEATGAETRWPDGAPASLLDFVEEVRRACRIPERTPVPSARTARRSETPRKRAQVEAFARVVADLAKDAERVVDVGSGHGHLTRELADRLGLAVLGLERDAAIADRARALAIEEGSRDVSFAIADVLSSGLALSPHDCAVGLHACGELGDVMVEAAAGAGAAIGLVGCCLQKRRAASRAVLGAGLPDHERRALELPRSILGLSNLTTREEGVEASRAQNIRARERRLALHRLLLGAGCDLELGAEIEGLNRRTAHGALDMLVARAFERREIPSPPATAIEQAARWAATHHARMRRLALPRSLLARALEVFVALDRAVYLQGRGYAAKVEILFPTAVSARNLVLVAAENSSLGGARVAQG